MASDAVAKTPTLEEQISEFKGFSTEDGKVVGATSTAAIAAAQTTEDKPKAMTAAERLAALDAPAKPAKAKEAAAEEGEDEGEEGKVEEEGDEEGEEEPKPEPERRPRRNDPQKRISDAVGKQRAAERERDAANARVAAMEARLARLEAGGLTNDKKGDSNDARDPAAPPDPADYQYGELDTKFIADTARFETLKTLREEEQRKQTDQTTQRVTAAQQEAAAKFKEFEAQGLTRYDDFDEVVTESAKRGEWALSPILASLLVDSDNGPDIAYHLASNKTEAAKVYAMTPAQQARWFGQRDAVLSSAPGASGRVVDTARVVSQAPEVPRREARGSGSRQQVSPDTPDFAAFEKLANAK